MKNTTENFWEDYYSDDSVVSNCNTQQNVGRTKNGSPVSDKVWDKTLDYLCDITSISEGQTVVELCCGNGEVIGELSLLCKKAIGVDYSKKLLDQMAENYGNKVEAIYANVNDVDFPANSIDTVIIYFSIQHFTEKQTVALIERALGWLKKDGKVLIGDIPDELKKWNYISKDEYRKDYFERLMRDEPMIGEWYNPNFFKALESFFTGIVVEVLQQPDYQINTDYRFDVLLSKVNNK